MSVDAWKSVICILWSAFLTAAVSSYILHDLGANRWYASVAFVAACVVGGAAVLATGLLMGERRDNG